MRKFLVGSLMILGLGTAVNQTSAGTTYSAVTSLQMSYSDQGNQFYFCANSQWFVCTRARIGSLSYDQFFTLVHACRLNGRSLWFMYDSTDYANTPNHLGHPIQGIVSAIAE